MTRVFWKICFVFYVFSNDLNFWTYLKFSSKHKKLFKKTSPTKVDSFLMSIFDQNQTCKTVLTENCQVWNFFAISLLYVRIKHLREDPTLCTISKYWNLKETRTDYRQKFLLKTNVDKIFGKSEKNKQNLIKQKNFDICFCVIFDKYRQIIISPGKAGPCSVTKSSLIFF